MCYFPGTSYLSQSKWLWRELGESTRPWWGRWHHSFSLRLELNVSTFGSGSQRRESLGSIGSVGGDLHSHPTDLAYSCCALLFLPTFVPLLALGVWHSSRQTDEWKRLEETRNSVFLDVCNKYHTCTRALSMHIFYVTMVTLTNAQIWLVNSAYCSIRTRKYTSGCLKTHLFYKQKVMAWWKLCWQALL